MNAKRYRALAILTCIGMFLVLIAGALVTNTDSGRGCGTDWPLCNGKFIPAYTVESLIEYSHRLISGGVGMLVLASFIATLVLYRKEKEPIVYASGAGLFTLLQALLGAAAVIWPTTPPVLALHFGISILAFMFTLLLVIWTYRKKRGTEADKPLTAIPRPVFWFSLFILVYSYCVVYLGAYVRHTDSGGGCEGWPLCNGEFVPDLHGATLYVFMHRVAAAVLFVLVGLLTLYFNRVSQGHPGLRKEMTATFVLICCQVLSGALLTATMRNDDWFIFTSILHNMIVSALFGILCDFMIRAWKWREGRPQA
ncbi:heme A synthase [Paenibacillus sacheonensis]|uniref:Heme A synthase n=1 Tax=Paenibacillus sacheonensis TaxID=742054 RepID=A0A7X4YNX9_9BACL|nr:COX15/CtaA family protein [Paenibacillus sacheonensis]NBC69788.1 heme A synthase [Paenibacillus sacheonensis]